MISNNSCSSFPGLCGRAPCCRRRLAAKLSWIKSKLLIHPTLVLMFDGGQDDDDDEGDDGDGDDDEKKMSLSG